MAGNLVAAARPQGAARSTAPVKPTPPPAPSPARASPTPAPRGAGDTFVPARAQGRAAGSEVLKGLRLAREGSSGAQVSDLQKRLGIAQTGRFDPATGQAVRQYQQRNGLQVDGQAGQQTWSALHGLGRVPPGTGLLGGGQARPAGVEGPARPAAPAPAPAPGGANRTATVDSVRNQGARNQMTTGRITINGNSYQYRSGGHGRGNLPGGSYTVTPHLWSRSDRSMSVGGVGYSFALSDKYDPRVGGTRSLLRIHPDGGSAGTEGCIGIVGDGATQRRFREDMRAELNRNGGRFQLQVG